MGLDYPGSNMELPKTRQRTYRAVRTCINQSERLFTIHGVRNNDDYTIRVVRAFDVVFGSADHTQKCGLSLPDQFGDDILDSGSGSSSGLVTEVGFLLGDSGCADIGRSVVVVAVVAVPEVAITIQTPWHHSAVVHLVVTLTAVDADTGSL